MFTIHSSTFFNLKNITDTINQVRGGNTMTTLRKVDLKNKYKEFYSEHKGNISIVEVPEFKYLMYTGDGGPCSDAYQQTLEAIFALSYHIKFAVRESREVDYGVMPLESQWWMDDMSQFSRERMNEWKWSAMIMQPNFITKEIVEASRLAVSEKKDLALLPKIELVDYCDGQSAQIMHIGPYADEAPTIEKLHAYIKDNGYDFTGKHREIYLNDPRKTAPENLKTLIRQPVVKL